MQGNSFDSFFKRLQSVSPIRNQSQLAEYLQVGRATVSLAKHKDKVPTNWIFKLSSEFGLNSDWLARGRGSPYQEKQSEDASPLVVQQVEPSLTPEGDFQPADDSPLQIDPCLLQAPASQDNLVSLCMQEEAMQPAIKQGDLLVIDRSARAVYPSLIYALGSEDSVLVRRLESMAGRVLVYGDNSLYPSRELDPSQWQKIRILGRVVLVCRQC